MFTKAELKEIAEAHRVVYEAIRPCFSNAETNQQDRNAAEEAASRIVAAKITANASRVTITNSSQF